MIKQVFLFVAFLLVNTGVFAQKDTYDQLKTQYDSLRKAENHEGALLVAKQMNAWALKNETDFLVANLCQLITVQSGHIYAVEFIAPCGGAI